MSAFPYYNKAVYLPQLLSVLEQQTFRSFGVIVVDDGSEPEAKAAFEALREKYRDRKWTFVSQPNSFVDAARNRAASFSKADYLLFVDADDVPARNAVERMLGAITLSGDDCLVTGGLLFADEGMPYDLASGALKVPILARYMPLGPDLLCGLVDPMVLGTSMTLVRRAAFERIGGYREKRGAAHEDWELQIRLMIAGFRVDVLPEYLLYFRKLENGLSAMSSDYEAKLRLTETYEDLLGKVGLRGLAATLISLLKSRTAIDTTPSEDDESRARRVRGLLAELLRRKAQGL